MSYLLIREEGGKVTMETVTKTAYRFDELTDYAKEKAISESRDINTDYEWYDDDYMLELWKEKYGIAFDRSKISFDIDRGSILYFTRGGIWVENPYKLARAIYGKGYDIMAKQGWLEFTFDIIHYGGRGCRNTLKVRDNRDSLSKDLPVDADEWLKGITEDYLSQLRKKYEYLTSDEAVIETIKVNEYTFTIDGKRGG